MLKLEAPRDLDIHTVADFAEILCLVTPDRFTSRDSIADYISDHSNTNLTDDELNDVFSHFAWRAMAYGSKYPFALEEHDRVLSGALKLDGAQQLYVLLLLCANLPIVADKSSQNILTDAFERVALQALKRLWPVGAEVRAFGKNETVYKGKKWERLSALGRDIGGDPSITETTYRKLDSGDGGIDLAAWIALDEHERLNIPAALAQCACSREQWPKKQLEISATRLGNHLRPSHPWMQIIFIPQSFRDNHGRWAVYGDVGGTIVMDRLRLLGHLPPEEVMDQIAMPALVTEFLETRLELV